MPLLWAAEELAAPLADRLRHHFAGKAAGRRAPAARPQWLGPITFVVKVLPARLLSPALPVLRLPPAACYLPPLQRYQFQAAGGWLKLQNTVLKQFDADHPFTRLVPDLSGSPRQQARAAAPTPARPPAPTPARPPAPLLWFLHHLPHCL